MKHRGFRWLRCAALIGLIAVLAGFLASCGSSDKVQANTTAAPQEVTVGVTKVVRKALGQELTVSSELVPFQQIDVYAKESGYVRNLSVDYGSRVKAGQVMAVLEIPELEMQLQQDDAMIKSATDQVTQSERELDRVGAQYNVAHLQYNRLEGVAKTQPGLVAQQEVDDAQGRDLSGEAQVNASRAAQESAESQLAAAKLRREHDQVLFDYSKITAPFAGVVTKRYANLGTLMQSGTNSSTQALPLVQLSQDNLFRLVIPVPESYVRYIHIGDPVQVKVSAHDGTFPGKVARVSMDVQEDTRTMHTEVDVANPNRVLMPGMYAEATITLARNDRALAVPLAAISHEGDNTAVYVVGPSNRLEKRPVTLGIQTANEAEAVTGLKEGESVVVSDQGALKAGEEVRPKPVETVQFEGGEGK